MVVKGYICMNEKFTLEVPQELSAIPLKQFQKYLKVMEDNKDDLIFAIPSSGIHSNGYSLVRSILKNNKITNNYILITMGYHGIYFFKEYRPIYCCL